jgi:hypothetical protein
VSALTLSKWAMILQLEWAARLMCEEPSLESIHVALSGPMGYALIPLS